MYNTQGKIEGRMVAIETSLARLYLHFHHINTIMELDKIDMALRTPRMTRPHLPSSARIHRMLPTSRARRKEAGKRRSVPLKTRRTREQVELVPLHISQASYLVRSLAGGERQREEVLQHFLTSRWAQDAHHIRRSSSPDPHRPEQEAKKEQVEQEAVARTAVGEGE